MDNIKFIYPLSEIQRGLLFEVLSQEHSLSIYLVQMVFSIHGSFNLEHFLKAFSIIINRYEILRSAITCDDGEYKLAIYNHINLPITIHDFSKRSNNFKLFLKKDLNKPFVLSQPPLMRLAYCKFNHTESALIWTRHHILMGGTSVEKVLKETFTIYNALTKAKPWHLPDVVSLETIYKSYQKSNFRGAKTYWKKHLTKTSDAGAIPITLKAHSPRTKKTIEKIAYYLEQREFSQLKEFINANKLTTNTILQAAWGITLAHHAGKEEFIFGSVRTYPYEIIEKAVGLFINTLPICFAIVPSMSVIDFLQQIRRHSLHLKKYVTIPINKIKEWNQLPFDHPLYHTLLDYKPYSLTKIAKEYLQDMDCTISFNLVTPYPVVLEVINEQDRLNIILHYNTSYFPKSLIKNLIHYFNDTILALIQAKKATLGIITKRLKQQYAPPVARRLKSPDLNKFLLKTAHQIFEEQATRYPYAPALVFQNRTMDYKTLNKKANQLAHYLVTCGVTIETPVAISLKSGFELFIAVLAVLKAGGAYVPIDTQYPKARKKYLIKDSQARFIITYTEQLNLFSYDHTIINIDKFAWGNYSEKNLNLAINPHNLMYIIYTSGSTGQPKGVLIEHRSIVNMAFACIKKFKVDTSSRILQIASFSFDVSVAEWSMALFSGACLYLINKDIYAPQQIMSALKEYKISIIILASYILTTLPREELPYLKVIAAGGETCDLSTISYWSKNRTFYNVYGITEAAVCSTIFKQQHARIKPSIIGKPIDNTEIHILDKDMSPCLKGVPGEIYIGGIGVSRGYLNKPSLNKKNFISNKFFTNDNQSKGFLYKTGDQGRWLDTGAVEFIGRIDSQVKLHGFRIELAEIEHAIEMYPNVKKAIVIYLIENKQLLAFYTSDNKVIEKTKLREFLEDILPRFMLPYDFIPITQFPTTANGKIDKKGLLNEFTTSQRSTLLLEDNQPLLKPQHSLRDKIINTIKELIPAAIIRTDVNFFKLGFDSISLLQLAVSLSKALGKKIDIVELFTYPSVDSLLVYLSNGDNTNIQLVSNPRIKKLTFKPSTIRFADE